MDIKPVADLFDGRDRRAVVSATDDVIERGLRDAGKSRHAIDGDVML